jgi:hypothetical protein
MEAAPTTVSGRFPDDRPPRPGAHPNFGPSLTRPARTASAPLRQGRSPSGWPACATLAYAKANHAPHGRLTETVGAIATATIQAAHAVLAARGEWVTNEKRLLERAGLRGTDTVTGALRAVPEALVAAVREAEEIIARALRS